MRTDAMKNTKFYLSLVFVITLVTSVYAYSLFDKVVYKEVYLRAANTTVLVNRVTSEVKYVLRYNGKMIELKGPSKKRFQVMYNLQAKSG